MTGYFFLKFSILLWALSNIYVVGFVYHWKVTSRYILGTELFLRDFFLNLLSPKKCWPKISFEPKLFRTINFFWTPIHFFGKTFILNKTFAWSTNILKRFFLTQNIFLFKYLWTQTFVLFKYSLDPTFLFFQKFFRPKFLDTIFLAKRIKKSDFIISKFAGSQLCCCGDSNFSVTFGPKPNNIDTNWLNWH